jgi:DNA-binding NtrC family response regulator
MPHTSGLQLLEELTEHQPDLPIVVMTATNEVDTAVACMRSGAIDYLVKPVDGNRLLGVVRRALELRALRTEVSNLRSSLLAKRPCDLGAFSEIVTNDPNMMTLFRYTEAIAPSPQPVLITGESGTGKELFAKALHGLSGRSGKLVTVNVAGLDDSLFSDTLFGHAPGAYTSAERKREGLVSAAALGTLFLDEIGDLSVASQIKLLRLLQDGTYYANGSDVVQRSKARIIVATNSHVARDTESGKFRKDLYFRLRTHQIEIPPLRSRSGDIGMLLAHFVERAANSLGKPCPLIPRKIAGILKTYQWPGNVRELEGMCFDAVARLEGNTLFIEQFRLEGAMPGVDAVAPGADQDFVRTLDRLPTLELAVDSLVTEALHRASGNQTIAAEMLGISRQALNKRLTRRKTGNRF